MVLLNMVHPNTLTDQCPLHRRARSDKVSSRDLIEDTCSW